MRICIPNKYGTWKNSGTGKAFFIKRLIVEFKKRGLFVTADPGKEVEITLGMGKFLYKPRSGKRVLRLGPCHFSTRENWGMLNERKKRSVKKADGVIYQSEWSKRVCRKYLGKNKLEKVIFNGAPLQKKSYKKTGRFVASTRKWLPQKRLKYLLKAFELVKIGHKTLDVYGETKPKNIRGVTFHGIVPPEKIDLAGKIFLHPVWLDASPNSVVEALAAGCQVICGSQGGTRELVKGNGRIVMDKIWDFKPVDLDKPPKLDIEAWVKAMENLNYVSSGVDNLHVDISTIADKYIEFFYEVLRFGN